MTQEPEVNTEKGLCDFDLHEEVCSDDIVLPKKNTFSAPISIVSASRPAAPSHFEGTLGWRGPTATNAFRPASPRKTSNGDKTVEFGRGSKVQNKGRLVLILILLWPRMERRS